jgi:PKD domain
MSGATRLTSTLAAALAIGAAGAAEAAAPLPAVGLSAQAADASGSCSIFSVQPGIGGVDVAANARGDTIASWTRNAGAGTQVVEASFRPAGGSFGPPQSIGSTSPCYRLGFAGPTPDVALDGQGGAVIVFQGLSDRGTPVARAAIKPAGGAFGAPVDLASDISAGEDGPRVAMNEAGTAVAVWSRRSGTSTIAQAATRPPGGAFASAVNLSETGADAHDARVAMNDAGATAVAWVRGAGTDDRAQARSRPAGQAGFAPIRTLSSEGTKSPDVGVAASGAATVVWARFVDGDNRIQARNLDPAGVLGTGIDDIAQVGDEREAPDLAVDPTGSAVVVFRACAGGDCVVKASARPPGSSFGVATAISPETDSNVLPKVTVDPAGVATAAISPTLAPDQILLTRRPPGGSFGAVERISPAGGGGLAPSLAADGEGNVLVGWSFHSALWQAQVSAFDAAPPALSGVTAPGSATVGQAVGVAAAATDRWSPVSLGWSFGDGASAAGGAGTHAFGSAGAFNATVTATDGAGNASSDTRAILVTPPPPATRPRRKVIRSKVRATWAVDKKRIFLLRLQVLRVPKGGKAELRCARRKSRQCPFKRKSSKKRRKGTITLFKEINASKAQGRKQRRFRAGQRVELRITKKNFIGKVLRYDLKKGKIPSANELCLPVGKKKKPRKRC